ncbi:MAG: hypothetical protein QNJ98_17955 [Planctomycetota bacterium]|nr:hypothetical protein [Planctomycetota bacterium]
MSNPLPSHYAQATRTVLRYAIVMAVLGLLSGVVFRESAKKLPDSAVHAGIGLEATQHLALVHGHMLLAAVIVPIAMLGAVFLSRAAGGGEITPRAFKMLTRGYLPFVTATIALMYYKGYHFLLSVRGGETDLVAIDAAYFGGATVARYAVYGVIHTAMFATLSLFLLGVWRSLRPSTGTP